MKQNKKLLGLLAVGGAFTIWGASTPILKLALEDIDPFVFGYIRFVLASLIIAGILIYTRRMRPILPEDRFPIFLSSFLGIFVKLALLLVALPKASAITTSLIYASGPVFAFFAMVWFFKEPYKRKTIVGMSIAFIGTLFTVLASAFNGAGLGSTGTSSDALLLIVVSMVFDIAYVIIAKRLLDHMDPLLYSFLSFIVAALCFFPFALWNILHSPSLVIFTPHVVFALAYTIILSSLIGYFLFSWGLQHVKGSKATIMGFCGPLIAIIISGPVLHEYPTPYHVIGFILIVLGIYWAQHHIHAKHHAHKML